MENTNKQIDESNLGAVWKRVAQLVKKITGDVDLAGKGTLQDQITNHTSTSAATGVLGHVKVDNALSSTSTNPVQNKVVNTALGKKLATTGDSKSNITTFNEASARANIASGETHATMFGKVKKWFADLTLPAFAQVITSYDDLMANTVDGYMVDAQAVKAGFESVNSDLDDKQLMINTALFDASFNPIFATSNSSPEHMNGDCIKNALYIHNTINTNNLNKPYKVHYYYTEEMPANCAYGIREVVWYDQNNVSVIIKGMSVTSSFGIWVNTYLNQSWLGWKQIF